MTNKKNKNLINRSEDAKATWKPHKTELNALNKGSHIKKLVRVDQIWEWLKYNHGNVFAVHSPHSFSKDSFTYKELSEYISTAAASFSRLGIKEGDIVACFAENSPRWLIADQGLMRAGGANAVRGATAPPNELKYILKDSGAVGLIVQNFELLKKLSLNNEQLNRLNFVILLEGASIDGNLSWEDFLSKGDYLESQTILKKETLAQPSNKIATILYTSGTTGKPKGVPLTHSNLLHQMRSLSCIANPLPGAPVLSVLPIWHSYERSAEYYFFSCACTQTYTTIKHLKNDLPIIKPVVMATVPRLWESVKEGFDNAVNKMPKGKRNLLKLAILNGSFYKLALRKVKSLMIERVTHRQKLLAFGEVVFRWPFYSISSAFLWPKILKQICGGELVFPISGGGAIPAHVDAFFESLGIEILVGYGLTETSPVISCRRPWCNVRGSAGQPLPETEIKIVNPETFENNVIGEKGLVMVRGPQVMSGYLGKKEETVKVLDVNGWFNTGDLGMLLRDGSLVLTGRAKDTIVLNSGENIEPGPLEEVLLASPLIQQVMLIGQDSKQLGALVVPQIEAMLFWASSKGLFLEGSVGDYPGNFDLRKLLRQEINQLLSNRVGSRSEERVCGVALVEPFTIENGLLTQTLKQRRNKIIERDHLAIKTIYRN